MTVVPPANKVDPHGTPIVGVPGTDTHHKAKVWDIAAGEWRIVERVDAVEMVNVGSASWTQPE